MQARTSDDKACAGYGLMQSSEDPSSGPGWAARADRRDADDGSSSGPAKTGAEAGPVRNTAETEAAGPYGGLAGGLWEVARASDWLPVFDSSGDWSGEVSHFHTSSDRFGELVYDPVATAAERWRLKRHLNEILPRARVAKCYVFPAKKGVRQVFRRTDTRRAFLHGFQTCGSPHVCTICGPKISERRKDEVQRAVDRALLLGLSVKMVTFTVPHGLGDDLSSLFVRMMDAWRATSTHRAGKAARDLLGSVGYIRVLEVTDGFPNGFHPHFHVLWFFRSPISDDAVKASFYPLWDKACRKMGFGLISARFGVQVQGAHAAAAYVSKGSWSIAHEMAKGVVKKGRQGRYTMMDLLRASAGGDKASRARFQAFAAAVAGKRHMYWSNGLKDLLGVEDLSDEDLASKVDEDSHELIFASLTDSEWQCLGRFGRGDWSVLLEVCGQGYEVARAFIDDLVSRQT